MSFRWSAWPAPALLCLQALTPAHAATTELQATSPWMIRYDEDRCSAVREFGSGETLHVMWLDQFGTESAYNLTLMGPMARSIFAELVTLKFGEEEPVRRSYVKSKSRNDKPVMVLYGVTLAPRLTDGIGKDEPISTAREAAIDRIELAGSGKRLVLHTGSLAASLAELRKCAVDLEEYLKEPKSRDAMPKGNPGAWMTSDDYPANEWRRGDEAVVRFRLMIDAQGVPSACQITNSSRSESFDDVSCALLMQRARFEPALDLSGKPVPSTFSSAIRFAMPD